MDIAALTGDHNRTAQVIAVQVVVRPAPKGIGADGNPLAIEVIILGNRRAALLVGLIGIVGVNAIPGLVYALRGPLGAATILYRS